jgi:hypothetical protein
MVEEDKKLTANEIRAHIKGSKELKSRLSGYSTMNIDDLRSAYARAVKGEVVSERKKSDNVWNSALKEWNKGRASYSIPKKSTKEHAEVMALVEKLKNPPKTKGSKVVPVVVEPVSDENSEPEENLAKVDTKKKRGRPSTKK